MEKRMPRCLGAFEADDPQCDGNPVGETADERAACVYRDRCAGFIKLMDVTGRPREFFVRDGEEPDDKGKARLYVYANHEEEFNASINEQIDAFGIRQGRVTTRLPAKLKPAKRPSKVSKLPHLARKPTKAAVKAGAKARDKALDKGRERSREVGAWYVKKLAERLKRKVAAFESAARPGDLYLVDKLETSGYCAVYCKGKGHKHAVSNFYYKPMTGRIEIRTACTFEQYEKAVPGASRAALKGSDHTGKDGAFKVRFQEVDNGGAAAVALALGQVYRRFDPGFPEAKEES